MAGKERTFAAVLVALLILTVLPSHTTGQVPGQISMECGGNDPEIVVKPGESSDGIVECTVTNDGTLIAESIEITSEFAGGPTISMAISEDSFSLEAGESQEVTITFSANERAEAVEHDFSVTATVTAWAGVPVENTPLSNNATHNGKVSIKPYGMVTLDMPDTSSRNMEVSQEISITFQVENYGNYVDTIDIYITNSDELEQLGFVLQSGDYLVARDLQSGGISDQLSFVIRAPSEAATEIRNQIVIEATSSIDNANDIIDFDIIVEQQQENGGLGSGLSEVSTDDLALYGAISVGIIFVLFLLVIIGRVSKRSSDKRVADEDTSEPPIEIEDDDDLDFDLDFDDDDFLSDDLDSMLDDL